ncbi:MAG TPA: hypothetical protein DCS93_29900 [Microscillaceae bacterium]|nr:hypothetical protein [Microscillaceae bacterium]
MKHIFYKTTGVLFLFFTLVSFTSFAQTTVSGTVKDASGEGLVGINVIIKGTVVGAPTDIDGKFSFTTNKPLPFKVQISGVGYKTQVIDYTSSGQSLDITMEEDAGITETVIISASRVEESILQSPVTVEKMDILAIKNTTADNFYDGLSQLKGVDLVPNGLLVKMINARGFGGPYQTRFVQRFDGMDMQTVSLSVPFGNIAGIHDIDVESVEVQPGAASALYGPNAFNGVMNMYSKSPFLYQGLTAQAKIAVNNVGNEEVGASPLYEIALRYGKAINDKFAYKVNLSYLEGTDWAANDQRLMSVDPTTTIRSVTGATANNGDRLNTYGDENPLGTVGGLDIHRTGYKESELTDYNVRNIRADLTLYYRLTDNIEASYMVKYAEGNGPLTGANRYSYRPQFVINKFELKGSNFFLRAYNMDQRMGSGSYDFNNTAARLQAASKDDATWLTDYTAAFNANGGNHAAARATADQGRLTRDSQQFDAISKNTPAEGGAAFIELGRITHLEGQYDFAPLLNNVVGLTVGASYRRFQVESDGTIFNDQGDKGPVAYFDIGAYAQITKSFLEDKIKLTASGRYDKSEFFDGLFSPRAALVFSPTKNHNIRASFQTGFKNPIFQEQSIFFQVGAAPTGLPIILAGGRQGLIDNVHTNSTDLAGNPINIPFVEPEKVTTFEVGYKGMITPELFFDVSYNRNTYENFIGADFTNLALYIPGLLTGTPDPAAVDGIYGFYRNLDGTFTTQGIAAGINYNLNGFQIGGNYTWANLVDELPVGFLPSFNTPEHKFNISVSNRKVTDKIGFNVAFRWQSAFDYFALLGGNSIQGEIASFNTVDAQITYKIRRGLTAKLGGSNLLNQYYLQSLGAPQIGGMYYLTITFDQFGR